MRHQRFQMLLLLGQRAARRAAFHLSKPRYDPCVDGIGFLQQTHTLGKIAHRPRIQNRYPHALRPQQREGLFLVSARRFQRHQLHTVFFAKISQRGDAFGTVSKRTPWPGRFHKGFQGSRTNIHSTNDSCHGNLPCTCDRWSGDCSVVRDLSAAVPIARRRLSTGGITGAAAASEAPQPRAPHSDIFTCFCRLYLDTRDLSSYVALTTHPASPFLDFVSARITTQFYPSSSRSIRGCIRCS